VVVAAVGEEPIGSSSWPALAPAHGWHSLEQVEELGDVVAVGAGERPGERDAAGVYEEMVLASAPAAVNRAGTCFGAPFFACR
jgi:predicted alpha-1,6-mannanase (GH76 family)